VSDRFLMFFKTLFSSVFAPFGGDDIDQLLFWLCKRFSNSPKEHTFNISMLDMKNVQHAFQMRLMKEKCCYFNSSNVRWLLVLSQS
jgi:hypothetical protein